MRRPSLTPSARARGTGSTPATGVVPFRVRRLAFDRLEENLHQRRDRDGFEKCGLERPSEDEGEDEAPHCKMAREEREHARRRRQEDDEDREGDEPQEDREPDCVLQEVRIVLRIEDEAILRRLPRIGRARADQVGEDHFVDIGERRDHDRLGDTDEALQRGDREEGGEEIDRAEHVRNTRLDHLVDTEEHRGFGEMRFDEFRAVVNLALTRRDRRVVEHFDETGDVRGLHQVENVLFSRDRALRWSGRNR